MVWCICKCFDISHQYGQIGSLRFAQRVKLLRTTAIINKKLDSAGTERRYAKEIIELRQELALKDALSGHTRISYDELT
jgi:hypothetical protein